MKKVIFNKISLGVFLLSCLTGCSHETDSTSDSEPTTPPSVTDSDANDSDENNPGVGETGDAESVVTDAVIMPDKYSTGVEYEQRDKLVDVSDLLDTQYDRLLLVEKNVEELQKRGVLEIENGIMYIHNIKLSRAYFNISGYPFKDKGIKEIHIKNCLFDSEDHKQYYSIQVQYGAPRGWDHHNPIYVDHCEFTGQHINTAVSGSMHMSNCLAYEFGCDAFGLDSPYGSRTNCYAYNGGIKNHYNGFNDDPYYDSHADFIQSTGSWSRDHKEEGEKSKVTIRSCRSDMIQYINADNDTMYLSNASSYNDCDYGDIEIDIQHMWAQGGSYTYRFEISDDQFQMTGNATDLVVGCLNMYGDSHHTSPGADGVNYEVKTAETLLVGSIWESDRIYVSVTNYTNEPRTFKIVTDKAEFTGISIDKCPVYKDFLDVHAIKSSYEKAYTPISWSDFPFDRLYAIPSDGSKWIKVYDTTDGRNVLVRTQVLADAGNYGIFKDEEIVSVLK